MSVVDWGRAVTVNVKHKPLVPLTNAQLAAIAAALGVYPDSEHVAAVRDALTRYVARGALTGGGDHRAADIKTLHALALAMDGINPNVLGWLARCGVHFNCGEPATIAAGARVAIKELERSRPRSRPGPKRHYSREALLHRLNQIYTEATGLKPTRITTSDAAATEGGRPTGQFHEFMRAVRTLAPDLGSADALTRSALKLCG